MGDRSWTHGEEVKGSEQENKIKRHGQRMSKNSKEYAYDRTQGTVILE